MSLERSPGRAGWAEIRRCWLCVPADTKNNKTLWGMNQIRSDRDTKTHALIQPVHFIISLLLFCSLFFLPGLHIFLSSCLMITALLFTLTGWGFFWKTWGVGEEHSCTLVRSQVWLASFTGINGPTNAPLSLLSSSFFYLIFSASLIPTLAQWSSTGAALGEQPWRKCHNRGISQMYIEPA